MRRETGKHLGVCVWVGERLPGWVCMYTDMWVYTNLCNGLMDYIRMYNDCVCIYADVGIYNYL